MESRREKKAKKKKKETMVTMEAVFESPGGGNPPFVGYFPTGYTPDDPSVRVFRNKLRPSRLDLVVSPAGANVEFVGTSYSGEAANPQLCSYALGVLDKDSQTLKIIPIASNKIFRLEPRVKKSEDMEPLEGLDEVGHPAGLQRADLIDRYGAKKNKRKAKFLNNLAHQKYDPVAREDLDMQVNDADINNEVLQDAEVSATRNIPPYDSSATIPEKAYLLDQIILKAEWGYLEDILELMYCEAGSSKVTFWQENEYPSFVCNRINILRAIQDKEEQRKLACIFSFITHLVRFWKMTNAWWKSTSIHRDVEHSRPVPIYQRLLKVFVDPVTNMASSEKRELLVGYILVLTLFADKFASDPADIANDLEMTIQSLRPYYLHLGCKLYQKAAFQKSIMTLSAPLEFNDQKLQVRRKKQ